MTLLFGGTLSRSQPSMPVFIYGEPSARKGLFVTTQSSFTLKSSGIHRHLHNRLVGLMGDVVTMKSKNTGNVPVNFTCMQNYVLPFMKPLNNITRVRVITFHWNASNGIFQINHWLFNKITRGHLIPEPEESH